MDNIETTDEGVTIRLSNAQALALTRILGCVDDVTGILTPLTRGLLDEFFTIDDMVNGAGFDFIPNKFWDNEDPSDTVAFLKRS